MKTRNFLLTLLLFMATTMSAQTILKGDMNDDNQVTISDVTSIVNVILGKAPQETINVGGSPYAIDNSLVVCTWYAPDGTHFTLSEDGTTDFPGGATYEFYPSQGRLLILNTSGLAHRILPLVKVTSAYLLAINYLTETFTYYTNSVSLVTGLAMSETSLAMNSGTTAQLSVSATPADAFNPHVTWSSSDESIATVDQNGLVTALVGGTATITATATDGSGQTATCELTITQMVTSITLSETHMFLGLDEFVRLTATVLPANAANKNITWTSSNPDVAPVRNGRVDAYDYGEAIITCAAADGSGVLATCKIIILNADEAYVDLGLPSGSLWATCNVGATSPEEYGDYFAWGETEGYNSGKTDFSEITYKWFQLWFDEDGWGHYSCTKYCNNSEWGYNGFTDELTELELEDDAAYVNWGPGWRMPSIEQYDELINTRYTTSEQTIENGVNGYRITSKSNGNSIFLPKAGWCNGTSFDDVGSEFLYWSRSFYMQRCEFALDLHRSGSGTLNTSGASGRFYGYSVRPVRSAE